MNTMRLLGYECFLILIATTLQVCSGKKYLKNGTAKYGKSDKSESSLTPTMTVIIILSAVAIFAVGVIIFAYYWYLNNQQANRNIRPAQNKSNVMLMRPIRNDALVNEKPLSGNLMTKKPLSNDTLMTKKPLRNDTLMTKKPLSNDTLMTKRSMSNDTLMTKRSMSNDDYITIMPMIIDTLMTPDTTTGCNDQNGQYNTEAISFAANTIVSSASANVTSTDNSCGGCCGSSGD